MEDIKIWIGDEYDGFSVGIMENDKIVYSVRIDQEDSLVELQGIFQYLGYQTEYEEIY